MRRLGSEREEEIEVLRRRKRRKEVWSLVGAFGGFGKLWSSRGGVFVVL